MNVVVIYDELDKMNEDILGVLFSKYKELFVEKDIFNFFIVNDTIYKNIVSQYITKSYLFLFYGNLLCSTVKSGRNISL